jgi:hypothetical protein
MSGCPFWSEKRRYVLIFFVSELEGISKVDAGWMAKARTSGYVPSTFVEAS